MIFPVFSSTSGGSMRGAFGLFDWKVRFFVGDHASGVWVFEKLIPLWLHFTGRQSPLWLHFTGRQSPLWHFTGRQSSVSDTSKAGLWWEQATDKRLRYLMDRTGVSLFLIPESSLGCFLSSWFHKLDLFKTAKGPSRGWTSASIRVMASRCFWVRVWSIWKSEDDEQKSIY